ncbi:MAG: phosphoglycerate kinase [Alphaproteobacteria bacterium]|nr:MAG: phosphoglycerate kinase [Alphaproteobacteria bacterium]
MTRPPVTSLDVAGRRLVVRADLRLPAARGKKAPGSDVVALADWLRPLLHQGASATILFRDARGAGTEAAEATLARQLGKALGVTVRRTGLPAADATRAAALALGPGDVLLSANLSAVAEADDGDDPTLAAAVAALGDIHVDDAFALSDRRMATTTGAAALMQASLGGRHTAERAAIAEFLSAAAAPAVAVVGGGTLAARADLLKALLGTFDTICLGGGVANAFLAADGAPMGRSAPRPRDVELARKLARQARQSGTTLLLPTDLVIARELRPNARKQVIAADACPPEGFILDIGPQTLREYQGELAEARRILFTGPVGAVDLPPFDRSSCLLARSIGELTRADLCHSLAGGEATVRIIGLAGAGEDFTHISTGGDAFVRHAASCLATARPRRSDGKAA